MANRSNLTEWLADNPKMMGALWMAMLLISEMGSAVANGGANAGP